LATEHSSDHTSDGLVSRKVPPGRTLVIGGGYVALECAGFLASLGFDVTVLLRSVPLRGFDRECAERVLASVEAAGATIVRGAEPIDAEATADGRTAVRWSTQPASTAPATTPAAAQPEHVFDTVLVATGRDTECAALHLEAVGLSTDPHGKLPTTLETSAVDFVHAVGDMASEAPHGRPELTPVAIRSGVLLARRLCGDPEHGISCADPNLAASRSNLAASAISGVARAGLEPSAVPTAVFTPSEYACVGLSEEEARTALGDANLEVYLSEATPLEHAPVDGRSGQRLFVKLLCDKAREERLVGVHVVGEGAAEIVPGCERMARGSPSDITDGPRMALGWPLGGPWVALGWPSDGLGWPSLKGR
jgi:thioredoxin reductase (NADPH)